jgi:hypothetical protein
VAVRDLAGRKVGLQAEEWKATGRGVELASITHITKEDFLPAFYTAFQAAITPENIQGGFRGAGLVPFDPEKVISQLDICLKTPTPSDSRPGSAHTWVSKTRNNPTEASSQSTLIKNRNAQHQNSSPTEILRAVDILAKGTSKVMHQLALLRAENQSLRAANEALSKRRRAKKQRLRQAGSLTVQMHRICKAREILRCRSRRKRRRVVVGSQGLRHERGVVASAASPGIMRALVG